MNKIWPSIKPLMLTKDPLNDYKDLDLGLADLFTPGYIPIIRLVNITREIDHLSERGSLALPPSPSESRPLVDLSGFGSPLLVDSRAMSFGIRSVGPPIQFDQQSD